MHDSWAFKKVKADIIDEAGILETGIEAEEMRLTLCPWQRVRWSKEPTPNSGKPYAGSLGVRLFVLFLYWQLREKWVREEERYSQRPMIGQWCELKVSVTFSHRSHWGWWKLCSFLSHRGLMNFESGKSRKKRKSQWVIFSKDVRWGGVRCQSQIQSGEGDKICTDDCSVVPIYVK